MANNTSFCHQSGAPPTRPNGRSANHISLPDLVARPAAGDTFEMEQRSFLYISGALCDGPGGVARVACLQPLQSALQHHMPGKFPILKPKDSTAVSPGGAEAPRQLRKNTYIRFQAGHVTPLAELLLNVAATMYV
jgi:hypothetical protein